MGTIMLTSKVTFTIEYRLIEQRIIFFVLPLIMIITYYQLTNVNEIYNNKTKHNIYHNY
jgi:hypothetical protein